MTILLPRVVLLAVQGAVLLTRYRGPWDAEG
jgi:hypothetical protein